MKQRVCQKREKKPKMRWLKERERDRDEIKKRIDLDSECEYH